MSFEQFLTQNRSHFARLDASVEGIAGIWHPDAPVDQQHIDAAERRLGVTLPASYKTFLRVCGCGMWCGEYVGPPDDVYVFDEVFDDMEGLVALVHNVRGVGDYVAMNPREQTGPGEWALYYCSHDPLGYGKIADSFESWAREAVTAFEKNEDLYVKADADVGRTWRIYQVKNKKWWQFWL